MWTAKVHTSAHYCLPCVTHNWQKLLALRKDLKSLTGETWTVASPQVAVNIQLEQAYLKYPAYAHDAIVQWDIPEWSSKHGDSVRSKTRLQNVWDFQFKEPRDCFTCRFVADRDRQNIRDLNILGSFPHFHRKWVLLKTFFSYSMNYLFHSRELGREYGPATTPLRCFASAALATVTHAPCTYRAANTLSR